VNSPSETKRALHLYELASSLAGAKGVFVTIGLMTFKEYRAGSLIVRYQPAVGGLDVWSVRKVLSAKRWDGTLRVARYQPGQWEQELEAAAAKSLSKR